MNVVDCINKANGKTLFSFEILPPLKGSSIKKLYDGIDPLMEFNPSFINVTYHREEYVYKKQPNGLLKRNATRKRPGTVGICAAIKNKYKVEADDQLECFFHDQCGLLCRNFGCFSLRYLALLPAAKLSHPKD